MSQFIAYTSVFQPFRGCRTQNDLKKLCGTQITLKLIWRNPNFSKLSNSTEPNLKKDFWTSTFIYENSKRRIFRYLAEPRNILAEPLGSVEPRLGITGLYRHF
jgi:hypothetical protein